MITSSYGGSLSGEHGDGQARAELLPTNVRFRNLAGIPRVQIHLGSGLENESGQRWSTPIPSPTKTFGWGTELPAQEPATIFNFRTTMGICRRQRCVV